MPRRWQLRASTALLLGGGLGADPITPTRPAARRGSGKTILAEQYTFHNATEQQPALYLSTVSEPAEKLLRYGQTLDFFDVDALGTRVFFDDLGQALNTGGLDAVLNRVRELIMQRRPGLITIDSFKALAAFAPDAPSFRRFLHDLAGTLSAFPATSFWVGEYEEHEIGTAPEFAVADGIISLTTHRESERAIRHLEVRKLRGTGFMTGQHAYRIESDGLHVYPRLAESSPARPTSCSQSGSRPASRRSTRCSPMATGRAPRRSWPGPLAPARR